MWLINTTTLELESFQGCPADSYAILSHTWGTDAQELAFDEFKAGEGRQKDGFWKIQKCCQQAREDDLKYAWVDTCCIDKRSSTELTEAINSMFTWYARAKVCYVYLADVLQFDPLHGNQDTGSFVGSRWFERGWTLQELIAPRNLSFYTGDWVLIGDKNELTEPLLVATGIRADVLTQEKSFRDCPVAQRMSWASKRKTAREEDIAYCLLGLFGVNMPLLYGESSQAFIRLQETIIQETDDETIFAWAGVDEGGSGLLAPSPANFAQSADMELIKRHEERAIYEKTNRGLRIEIMMLPCEMNTYVVPLQCERRQANSGAQQVAIFLCKTITNNQYRRVPVHGKCMDEWRNWQTSRATSSTIFVPNSAHNVQLAPHAGLPIICVKSNIYAWQFPKASSHRFPHESPEDWTAARTNQAEFWHRFAASEPHMIHRREVGESALNQPLPGLTVREDLERQSTTGYGAGDFRWLPKKVRQAIQFQSHHLDTSVLIAFTRSGAWQGAFYYYLELGFNPDFKPVCILHSTKTLGSAPLWIMGEDKLLTGSVRFDLPVCDSFWEEGGTSRWSPMIYGGEGSLQKPLKATGNSRDELEICVNTGGLSSDSGRVNVRVDLRPSSGLEWELVFREEYLRTLLIDGPQPYIREDTVNLVKKILIYTPVVSFILRLIGGRAHLVIGGVILSFMLNLSFPARVGLCALITIWPTVAVYLVWKMPTIIKWWVADRRHTDMYVQINGGEKEKIT
jgi:hypothetical protein